MATILVTGCAGFIAARVCELLLARGDRVVGIDNVNDYYDTALKQHRLRRLIGQDRFEFHEIDIESLGALANLFDETKFDAVVNLAARAGVRYSIENPHVYLTTNANGSLNLLELMRKHGVKKFVLASTSSLYAGQAMPFVETLPVNTPISPYAASKKAAEVMAYAYHHLFDIDVTVVRYFTVYGPSGRPDMSIFRFVQQIDQGRPLKIFGDGTQSRDFTFVDDIARGTIAAQRPLGFEIVNLGGGQQPVSIRDVIATLEKLLGKQAEVQYLAPHEADMQSTWADISKAGQLLEWQPEVSLDDGLQATVDWYQENLPWSAGIQLA